MEKQPLQGATRQSVFFLRKTKLGYRRMADNQNPRLRLGRPSQTASTRRERAQWEEVTGPYTSRIAHASSSRDHDEPAIEDTQTAQLRAAVVHHTLTQGHPGGPIDLSLLIYYTNHAIEYVWEREERPVPKSVNHAQKIYDLVQPDEDWFRETVLPSGLVRHCCSGYITISHDMQGAFVERWHRETSSFHFPVGEMTITLDDFSCLLHLPIKGRLLNHRNDAVDWMITYLGAQP